MQIVCGCGEIIKTGLEIVNGKCDECTKISEAIKTRPAREIQRCAQDDCKVCEIARSLGDVKSCVCMY